MAYSRNITLFYNPNNENDALPIEVIDHIGRFSGTKGIGRLRKVCKNAESSLSRTLVESMVQSLLKHVMWGEQDQAENIISKLKISCPDDYSLAILQKSSGVEHCDRVWKLISPLEFAAQAGDKFMVDMLLKYISPAYKQRALDQLKYVLHQGTEHGKHLVALTLVIDAYE